MSVSHAEASSIARPVEPLGVSRFSVTQFLIALGLLIFATPFIDRPPFGDEIEAVVMSIVLVTGALAVGGRKPVLAFALILAIAGVSLKWIRYFQPQLVPDSLVPAVSLVFMGLLIYQLTRFILKAPHVDREVVCASICTYICMGLLWTFAYILVSIMQPNSFAAYGQAIPQIDSYDAFYFSYITLISIGYGDFTPVSRVAKMLAVLEGITGLFYVVTLISRLVAMYTSKPTKRA